jgi:trimeric autotransporter adhesin
MTLYGNRIGPGALTTFALDVNGRIPTELGGVRVYFNGIPAPVLYASATQTSVIAPFRLAGQTMAKVSMELAGVVTGSLLAPVRPADPGLFSFDRSGTGPGAISESGWNVELGGESGAARVDRGFVWGRVRRDGAGGSGWGITGVANLPVLRAPVSATVGGAAAVIEYAGPAPGAVAGLYQVNLRVPAGLPAGAAEVRVTVGEAVSQSGFTVAVGGQ